MSARYVAGWCCFDWLLDEQMFDEKATCPSKFQRQFKALQMRRLLPCAAKLGVQGPLYHATQWAVFTILAYSPTAGNSVRSESQPA